MSHRTHLAAAMIGIIAVLGFAGPVDAGTCSSVKAKGRAQTVAKATAEAQDDLKQKAKRLGGRVTQTSMNCVPGPSAVVCKIDAVVCPK